MSVVSICRRQINKKINRKKKNDYVPYQVWQTFNPFTHILSIGHRLKYLPKASFYMFMYKAAVLVSEDPKLQMSVFCFVLFWVFFFFFFCCCFVFVFVC